MCFNNGARRVDEVAGRDRDIEHAGSSGLFIGTILRYQLMVILKHKGWGASNMFRLLLLYFIILYFHFCFLFYGVVSVPRCAPPYTYQVHVVQSPGVLLLTHTRYMLFSPQVCSSLHISGTYWPCCSLHRCAPPYWQCCSDGILLWGRA